jgi:sugar transferase (PEP-CTERM/EpsH1 system associated)
MRKINILQLMTDSKIGGAEKVVLELAKRLNKDKFSVIICCLTEEGPIFNEAKKENIRIFALGIRNKFCFLRAFKLFKLLKDEKIDILQSHLFHANLLGRILGRIAGVRILISTEHIMGLESRPRIWLNKLTSFLVDRYIAISFGVADFLSAEAGISPLKITVVQNGIDLDKYAGVSLQDSDNLRASLGFGPADKVIGTVARLHKQKGHIFLLWAAKNVIRAAPDAKLLIVGDGPLRSGLENMAVNLGIKNNVIFSGFRDDIAGIMRAIDLFVLPSLWEGLPLTILEAMAAKKPVIATKVGGVAEIVEDGITGVLVKPRDPNALAGAIIKLISDNQLREKMGDAGWRNFNEHFNAERMVRETEILYEMLIKAFKDKEKIS